jgi:hypothetical protein
VVAALLCVLTPALARAAGIEADTGLLSPPMGRSRMVAHEGEHFGMSKVHKRFHNFFLVGRFFQCCQIKIEIWSILPRRSDGELRDSPRSAMV